MQQHRHLMVMAVHIIVEVASLVFMTSEVHQIMEEATGMIVMAAASMIIMQATAAIMVIMQSTAAIMIIMQARVLGITHILIILALTLLMLRILNILAMISVLLVEVVMLMLAAVRK